MKISLFKLILGPLLLGAASPAHADIAVRYAHQSTASPIDVSMTIEVNDDGRARIQQGQQPQYMLVVDGVVYVVERDATGLHATRLGDAMTVLAEAMDRLGINDMMTELTREVGTTAQEVALIPQGITTVRGRRGTSYRISSEEESRSNEATLVLSEDQALAPVGRALGAMWQASFTNNPFAEVLAGLASSEAEMAEVMAKGTPLRFNGLELADLSDAAIDDSRFALPATVVTIDQLRAMSVAFPPAPTLPPPPARTASDRPTRQ